MKCLLNWDLGKAVPNTCFGIMGTTTDCTRAMANWFPVMDFCRVLTRFNLYVILCHSACMLIYFSRTSLTLIFRKCGLGFRPQLVRLDCRAQLRVEPRLFSDRFYGKEMLDNFSNILRTG
jgi:hypothetical protein